MWRDPLALLDPISAGAEHSHVEIGELTRLRAACRHHELEGPTGASSHLGREAAAPWEENAQLRAALTRVRTPSAATST
jgi:hypothetical protein